MNKIIKFMPVCLLIATAASGCSGSGNKLADFVAGLSVGEHTQEEIEKIYETGVIDGADYLVKNSFYRVQNYAPYWAYNLEGATEEEISAIVEMRDEVESFSVSDNNVVTTAVNSVVYPYDKTQVVGDQPEGLAEEPTVNIGEAKIWAPDSETVNYVYTARASKTDPYSFYDTYSDNAKGDMLKAFTQGGGFGTLGGSVVASKNDVVETYEYYATNWTDMNAELTFSALKSEDGSLKVKYSGDLCMTMYSAERIWAYDYAEDDANYEHPIGSKKTELYNGCYVDRRIRFFYEYDINGGVMTEFRASYFSYWTKLYKDSAYNPASDLPPYPLTQEMIDALKPTLYIPDFLDEAKTIENPYKGISFDDYLPYTMENYQCNAESNGDYDLATLPSVSEYRKQDGSDKGAWFNALTMHDVEENLE